MRGVDEGQVLRWEHDEVFNTLIYCESVENVRQILVATESAKKAEEQRAYEICCCLQQGRSYYEAADKAPDTVRPLLLYYGMVSFAGAIILAKGTKQSLAEMSRRHGLAPPDFTEVERVDCCSTHLTESRGTFHELVDSCSEIRFPVEGAHPGPLARIRSGFFLGNRATEFSGVGLDIKGLASRLPDLRDVYRLTYTEDPQVFNGDTYCHYRKERGELILAIHMGVYTQHLATGHPLGLLATSHSAFLDLLPQEFQYDGRAFAPRGDHSIECPLPMFTHLRGGAYFISPFKENLFLSEICIYYAMMYVLSMLVRYRPDFWMSILHRRGGDRIMALVQKFIQLSFDEFPKLVILEITPRT